MDRVKLNITVELQERWVPHFLGLLKRMQVLGQMGSSEIVRFFSDGDGDFRPTFTWDSDVEPARPHQTEHGEVFDAG